MHTICEHIQWFEWWHARWYHFLPVYRGFWLSGLNLAEVGHSMLKFQQGHTKISLVDASFKDIAFQMRQDEKYIALINNEDGHVGSELNYQKMIERAHKAQQGRAHAYINVLKHGDVYMEAESLLDDPSSFQPDERDKHHYVPPTNSSKGGKCKQIETKNKSTTTGAKVRKQPVEKQNDSAPQVSNITAPDIVPQKLEDELLKTWIPCVLLYNKIFLHCETCGYQWDINYMDPPHNLVFHMRTFR